jgi:hypothetical protein
MAANSYQASPLRTGEVVRQILLLLTYIALVGCSPSNLATVTGSVTVDGEPAKVGAIAFFAVHGKAPTAGAPIVDGKYSALVTPGLCTVQVRVSKIVGKKKIYDTPNSPVREVWAEVLPPKYNDDSQLKLEVKPGANKQDYDLISK